MCQQNELDDALVWNRNQAMIYFNTDLSSVRPHETS